MARTKEKCPSADFLFHYYSNPFNKVYLSFLSSGLGTISELNQSLQSDSVDVTFLHDYFLSLLEKIVQPKKLSQIKTTELTSIDFTELLIPHLQFDIGFNRKKILDSFNPPKETTDQALYFCFKFTVELAIQIQKLLSDNLEILRISNIISPNIATSQANDENITTLASKFQSIQLDMQCVEREWKLIPKRDQFYQQSFSLEGIS